MASEMEIDDVRIEFVCNYVMRTMKLKPDRWTKMFSIDENKQLCLDFFDKPESTTLILYVNAAGGLSVTTDWPTNLKAKASYFVKKSRETVGKDVPFRNAVLYGDISAAPIDQLSAFVDEVKYTNTFMFLTFHITVFFKR